MKFLEKRVFVDTHGSERGKWVLIDEEYCRMCRYVGERCFELLQLVNVELTTSNATKIVVIHNRIDVSEYERHANFNFYVECYYDSVEAVIKEYDDDADQIFAEIIFESLALGNNVLFCSDNVRTAEAFIKGYVCKSEGKVSRKSATDVPEGKTKIVDFEVPSGFWNEWQRHGFNSIDMDNFKNLVAFELSLKSDVIRWEYKYGRMELVVPYFKTNPDDPFPMKPRKLKIVLNDYFDIIGKVVVVRVNEYPSFFICDKLEVTYTDD